MEYIRNSDAIVALGQRVKHLREAQNISQAQLAFEAGIPRNQIGRIERGEINTSVSTLFAIAHALNLHPRELLDFEIN